LILLVPEAGIEPARLQ